jgi:hypothetical protein
MTKTNKDSTKTTSATKTRAGVLTINTRYPKGEETEVQELIVKTYPTDVPLASVSAEGSVTKNLGNYESIRIQASITLPCAVEETAYAYAEAWKRVEEQLTTKVIEVTSGKGGNK